MERNVHEYKSLNLIGERHEKLVVIRKSDKGRTRWICRCDCGKEVELTPYYFYQYKSCGCLEKENRMNLSRHNKTHGMTKSILYHKYCGMKERCFNPNYKHFDRYGGRGITICEEWLGENGFANFMKWAYENGYDDNKHGYDQSIDRIDIDKNYEPSNCRWVNQIIQSNNRSNNRFIDDNGENITLSQFCRKHNIDKPWFVTRRLEKGYTVNQLLEEWLKK